MDDENSQHNIRISKKYVFYWGYS